MVAAVPLPGSDSEAVRIEQRARALARLGPCTLFAPAAPDGPLMIPGLRHMVADVPPGGDRERVEGLIAEAAGPLLDGSRPSLVHAFGVRLAVPALLRRRSGARVVLEPGETPAHRLRALLPDAPPTRLEDLVELEDKTLARADAVIARSPLEAATLVKRGVPTARIVTAPDGLPADPPETEPGDLPQLVAVVEHAPDRAAALLLSAMARVPGSWRLTLLGPTGWSTGALERQARHLKVEGRLALARIDADTALRVGAAQAVVCPLPPGRAVTAGAIVPAAAMWALACRRPLIAPDLPAVRAWVGGAARFYPAGDTGLLAKAVMELLGHAAARVQIGEAIATQRARLTWHGAATALTQTWTALSEHAESSPD